MSDPLTFMFKLTNSEIDRDQNGDQNHRHRHQRQLPVIEEKRYQAETAEQDAQQALQGCAGQCLTDRLNPEDAVCQITDCIAPEEPGRQP